MISEATSMPKPIIVLSGLDQDLLNAVAKTIHTNLPEYKVCVDDGGYDSSCAFSPFIREHGIYKLLSKYSFEDRHSLPLTLTPLKGEPHEIFWFIIESTLKAYTAPQHQKGLEHTAKSRYYYSSKLREISGYYGVPLLQLAQPTQSGLDKLINQIAEFLPSASSASSAYSVVRELAVKDLTFKLLSKHLTHELIIKHLASTGLTLTNQTLPQSLKQELFRDGLFKEQVAKDLDSNDTGLALKVYAWWLSRGEVSYVRNENSTYLKVTRQDRHFEIPTQLSYVLDMSIQGQSKQIFKVLGTPTVSRYYNQFVLILLKSTIYSHTKQCTGEIKDLGKVRGYCSKLFLELMHRNCIDHAYRAIGKEGIILSERIQTTALELVFKKYCAGTDKHSFFGIDAPEHGLCLPHPSSESSAKYKGGVYVRFDWRNPNHTTTLTSTDVSRNPFYYVLERHYQKEVFFKQFLSDLSRCKPFGDKCISPDLLVTAFDVEGIRAKVLELYTTFQYYMKKLDLEILDGCVMLDKMGKKFWSEINPDCMRIRAIEKEGSAPVKYDKDIWRAGGSSSKAEILQKWTLFGQMLTSYFLKQRFEERQAKLFSRRACHYQALQTLQDKDLILPKIAKYYFEKLTEKGTNPNRRNFLIRRTQKLPEDNFRPYEQLVTILQVESKDFNHLQSIAQKYPGLRLGVSLDPFTESKEKSCDFLNRIYVKVDMLHNIVNTVNNIKSTVQKGFCRLRLEAKGDTSEEYISELVHRCLINVQTRIQGIQQLVLVSSPKQGSDVSWLRFVWTLHPKVVPEIDALIRSFSAVYAEAIRYDRDGLVATVITNHQTKLPAGLIYLNDEAVRLTLETQWLHRYSRQHSKIMKKGDTSGDTQLVTGFSLDCDSDSLLIEVSSDKNFCHNSLKSCYL